MAEPGAPMPDALEAFCTAAPRQLGLAGLMSADPWGSSFRAVCRWRCSSVVFAFCREGGRGPGCWRHPGTAAPRRVDDSKSHGSSFRALSHGRAGRTEARRLRGFQHGSAPEAAELARVCQAALGSGLRGSLHSSAPEAAALSHGRAGHTDARRPRGFVHGGAPAAGPRRMVAVHPGAHRSEPCAVEVAAQV